MSILWKKVEADRAQPGCDVYTARIGELTGILTVDHMKDHPTIPDSRVQEMSIRFVTTVRSSTTYTNALLEDRNAVAIVEENVLRTADEWVGHLRRSMGPDMEVPMVAKYLIDELCLGDMGYTVRDRALEEDYELPAYERHNGDSWTHPKVLRFKEMLRKVKGWIKP